MTTEPTVASLAAENFTNAHDIHLISKTLEKIKSSTSGSQELLDAENALYFAILVASKNSYFIGMHKCIHASNNLRFRFKGQDQQRLNEI